MNTELVMGLSIPFIGTTLGAASVFLMKNKMNDKVEKLLMGFASGVMIAASVWSLIIPSIDMAEEARRNSLATCGCPVLCWEYFSYLY